MTPPSILQSWLVAIPSPKREYNMALCRLHERTERLSWNVRYTHEWTYQCPDHQSRHVSPCTKTNIRLEDHNEPKDKRDTHDDSIPPPRRIFISLHSEVMSIRRPALAKSFQCGPHLPTPEEDALTDECSDLSFVSTWRNRIEGQTNRHVADDRGPGVCRSQPW